MMEPGLLESSKEVCRGELSAELAQPALQTMIDAFPDSTMVIDLDHHVVLANRIAREVFALGDLAEDRPKCYRVFHHQEAPCAANEELCPVRAVVDTKAPARVTHAHYDSEGREIFVEITAAPVFDRSGEVVRIVESCRDITERRLTSRLLAIGSRHMQMGPLLDEMACELRSFTGCHGVGICVVDDEGGISFGRSLLAPTKGSAADRCICEEIIDRDAISKFPFPAEGKSIRVECSAQLRAAWPGEMGERLADACRSCGCNAFALVPISLGGQLVGLICVADPRPEMVSAKMVGSLERLAMELGETIYRVRSEEALRAARDQLEARVKQRTAELTEANQALEREVAERKRLQREILQVGAMEQRRIGQDLHDGVGQELTGMSYLAQGLYQKLSAAGLAEAETAGELAGSIPRVLGKIREVVKGLMPLEGGAGGLESALSAMAANVQKQTGIACRFESRGGAHIRDDDTAVQVFRIAQEAVTNAVKHARARHIAVALEAARNQVLLEVCDDGIGLRPSARGSSGCGLRTMSYRARAIGGTFEVQCKEGGGTLVTCALPQRFPKQLSAEDSTGDV